MGVLAAFKFSGTSTLWGFIAKVGRQVAGADIKTCVTVIYYTESITRQSVQS